MRDGIWTSNLIGIFKDRGYEDFIMFQSWVIVKSLKHENKCLQAGKSRSAEMYFEICYIIKFSGLLFALPNSTHVLHLGHFLRQNSFFFVIKQFSTGWVHFLQSNLWIWLAIISQPSCNTPNLLSAWLFLFPSSASFLAIASPCYSTSIN